MGERNALRALDLPKGASQEQITQKWRQLSRQWHPDKFRDPEEKIAAQAKFMAIKEAYDKLSVIHSKRKKQNSRSRTVDVELNSEENHSEL
jgi:DnaJ family protein C protein 22